MIWVGTVRVPVNALRRSTFNVQRNCILLYVLYLKRKKALLQLPLNLSLLSYSYFAHPWGYAPLPAPLTYHALPVRAYSRYSTQTSWRPSVYSG